MNLRLAVLVLCLLSALAAAAQSNPRVTGTVLDPAGRAVAGARVEFGPPSGPLRPTQTGNDGSFDLSLPAWGAYTVRVDAAGFAQLTRTLDLNGGTPALMLRLEQVTAAAEEVIVTGDASNVALTSPDPSEKVLVREELLDANPGRPGAPISIPGLPIETASGGIKAPQYFVPGVAGDHGEPIAQYIAVGGYLVANNLSANAHGNGYADPNIFVSGALGSVTTDGGAFNVLEGNHALNLAATYGLRPHLGSFLTLTGDYRDADLTAGLAPRDSGKKEWLAVEANYGNGLMLRLEHRAQFKWNAMRIVDAGRHEITLFSLGYWGRSNEGNLVPVGDGVLLGDTVDPRQFDQTHTTIQAIDDVWRLGPADEFAFSGFFRTYNLSLFSNFGEGLIRQSEFRTVEGAEARETHAFTAWLKGMAGFDYHEDDIRRDNLDHYLSDDVEAYQSVVKVEMIESRPSGAKARHCIPAVCGPVENRPGAGEDAHTTAGLETGATPHVFMHLGGLQTHGGTAEAVPFQSPIFAPGSYGPFLKVLSNDVTIRDATPYVALNAALGRHVRFYAGLRPDTIELKNADRMNPAFSFDRWSTFLAPKATVAWSPAAGRARWLPTASLSMGQAFFTEDPRIAVAAKLTASPGGASVLPSPFERSHSGQLVLEKEFAATDVRVTLGRTTTTETLGKIDPDNGTQDLLGPGTLKFFTASVGHRFSTFGTLQGVISKADARLLGGFIDGQAIVPQLTPEAPRTIFDALTTLDRLPAGLHARGEYEYVGHKQLDLGNAQHPDVFEAIPVGETRLAVVRPFLSGRLELGANGMLARGYTGQTTEAFDPGWRPGAVPYCAAGSGPSGAASDFDCGTNERSVGVRMVSWVGGSVSWRFGEK